MNVNGVNVITEGDSEAMTVLMRAGVNFTNAENAGDIVLGLAMKIQQQRQALMNNDPISNESIEGENSPLNRKQRRAKKK